jgi:hypothetical protein
MEVVKKGEENNTSHTIVEEAMAILIEINQLVAT